MLADQVLDGIEAQQTFGGLDITVRRNAFGRQVDSFEASLPFDGGAPVTAVFIRAPWVERAGLDVEVLPYNSTSPDTLVDGRTVEPRTNAPPGTKEKPTRTAPPGRAIG